jgi:hypothetical protein
LRPDAIVARVRFIAQTSKASVMKLATLLATVTLGVTLAAAPGACRADPLTDKSTAPDWGNASQADKDAWIAAFKFEKADADPAAVAACLDQYAAKPLFKTNALAGVTSMCETIAALPE